jgi:hypothetical protein
MWPLGASNIQRHVLSEAAALCVVGRSHVKLCLREIALENFSFASAHEQLRRHVWLRIRVIIKCSSSVIDFNILISICYL